MPNELLEEWAGMIWEKAKLIAAVIFLLLLDLGFVVVWGLVLLAFHWIIGQIDPTRSLVLLKVIEYISEISTLSVVGFSIVIDTKKTIRRIWQEDKQKDKAITADRKGAVDEKKRKDLESGE
jgi:hypothetical protein